jgi:C1A family cysteine protease
LHNYTVTSPVVTESPEFSSLFPVKPIDELPEEVDLSEFLLPARNQLRLGSCTAFSSCILREGMLNQRKPGSAVRLSEEYVYYRELELQGYLNPVQDLGAPLSVCTDVWLQYGACIEDDDVYNPATIGDPPSPTAIADARQYRVQSVCRLSSLEDILNCLAQGHFVQAGVSVYSSFESQLVAETGDVPLPGPGDTLLGGHAICLFGSRKASRRINFRNSWGPLWGKDGNGMLPFEYFTQPNLFIEAFAYFD